MTGRLPWAIVVTLLGLTIPAVLSGQSDVEKLDFDRPEAWALKYFTSVALFSGMGVPRARPSGAVEFGLEGGWIPALSESERRVGFNGTKLEDLNKAPVFGRIRATFGLPSDFTFSFGIVPPLNIGGAEPSLFAVAVGRPLAAGPGWRVGARAYGQLGSIVGDFTCDRETVDAGSDPVRNPFQCEEVSDDEVTQQVLGLELSAALVRGAWEPYLAIAANYMDLEFQVAAQYSGFSDSSRLLTSGVTASATAGLAYETVQGLRFATEVFLSPLGVQRPPATSAAVEWLINGRGMVSYRIR